MPLNSMPSDGWILFIIVVLFLLFRISNAARRRKALAQKIKDANIRNLPNHVTKPSVNVMTPIGFENHCAKQLRDVGWCATLTPHSGDQGADIVARRASVSLVVQCKLYSSPIGNAAVQEAIAARVFYGATYAAVVSNQPYTASARELALRADVVLMAPTELSLANVRFT